MINAKILPTSVNADNDPKFLDATEVLNVENLRIGVSEDGKNLQVKNFPSTQLIYQVTIPYNNVCIGTSQDLGRQRLFGFIWNDYGLHTIYCYDLPANTIYTVLLSSQTEKGFNWSRTSRIDRNARVVGDWLIYTDNNNEPQFISIEAGIKLNQPSYDTDVDAYATPIPYTTLTLICRPPIYRLQVEKITDNGFFNNFILNNAYQFCYRYWYKDYRYSVLSIYSQLMPLNGEDETSNAINVKMPFGEDIPNEVQQVEFCVKYGNFGKTFVIRSWNRNNFYDLLAIQAHNANTVQLGITFYDNVAGIPIDDVTANTSFDDVALQAKTLESARNRIFPANVLKGYDTPADSSLNIQLSEYNTDGAGVYSGQWKYFNIQYRNTMDGSISYQTIYYGYIVELSETSWFFDSLKFSTSPGSTQDSANATSSWSTEIQLAAWYQRNYSPPAGTVWIGAPTAFFDSGSSFSLLFAVDLNGLAFFKSSGSYQVVVNFYDRFRRKCGVTKPVQITVPQRTYSQTIFATNIIWQLNNTDALNEIPDWAYYYSIAITKDLTTRFFMQVRINEAWYVDKNQDGTYDYTKTAFDDTVYAVGFNLTPFSNIGMGYTYTAGDYINMYVADIGDGEKTYVLRIIGQDGNFVLCAPIDVGTLGDPPVANIIEIYTPYFQSENAEPFYETGDMMIISNPTTSSRQYSVTSDTINGDCYAIQRVQPVDVLYYAEAMSPNDRIWQIWQQDRGWTNFIDTIGQQRKETNIDWSDVYINGTKVNGLNKFQPTNIKDVGNSSGAITKLQLTNKQTEDGTVMLVMTEEDHLSAYLQEVQLVAAATNNSIVQTADVIGTINALRNGKGTINPESVEFYEGVVWGISVLNGVVWQYSNDGITIISDYGMNRFFDRYCKKYIANGYNSDDNPIFSLYDPSAVEWLLFLPAVEDVNFPPILPSYDGVTPTYASSIQNRFDIYDGQAKATIYKPLRNQWTGAYQYVPDCMSNLGDKVFGFKNANLYLHNEDFASFNTIYGTQYPQRICLPVNAINPSVIKDVMNLVLEINGKIPNYTVLYSEYPYEQITDLTASDYIDAEGNLTASFLRDRLDPNVEGTVINKLYEGENIKSALPLLMIEWREYDSQLILNFVNVGLLISTGHNDILNLKKGDG